MLRELEIRNWELEIEKSEIERPRADAEMLCVFNFSISNFQSIRAAKVAARLFLERPPAVKVFQTQLRAVVGC
ncbi:MAG: hypothetical protein ACK4Q5_20470 [Saprospiraceae bacterium]